MRGQADRSTEILHAIVRSYIQSGEPVASVTISRTSQHKASPATVRNVMADLTDSGYLSQPHTSAGRVPTARAFLSFVQSLNTGRLLARELERLREILLEADTVDGRFECTSRMLTQMTHGVGIAAAIPTSGQALEQVELVSLGRQRVLMVVATRDKMVRNRVVTLDEPIRQDELNSIRNYINRNFGGRMLTEVRAELRQRLAAARAAYDEILKKLVLLFEKGLLDIGFQPEVHLDGASNLAGHDLHLTRHKTRELFHTLEEKERVLELLERFLETAAGDLGVQIGLGEAHPSMRELSLIGMTVALPGGLSARIAVLGPMRMNYERAMSAVRHVGEAFQSLPA